MPNPKFDGTTSNQPNFYRPYLGYSNTTDYGFRREFEL